MEYRNELKCHSEKIMILYLYQMMRTCYYDDSISVWKIKRDVQKMQFCLNRMGKDKSLMRRATDGRRFILHHPDTSRDCRSGRLISDEYLSLWHTNVSFPPPYFPLIPSLSIMHTYTHMRNVHMAWPKGEIFSNVGNF